MRSTDSRGDPTEEVAEQVGNLAACSARVSAVATMRLGD